MSLGCRDGWSERSERGRTEAMRKRGALDGTGNGVCATDGPPSRPAGHHC